MSHVERGRFRFVRGCLRDIHRFQRCRRAVIHGGAGGFLFILLFLTAHGVAAGAPGPNRPPATQPAPPPVADQSPPTRVPASGAAGQLNPGAASPAASPGRVSSPPASTGPARIMPLQPPTAEMPPVTATSGAVSSTAGAPTAPPTATRPPNTRAPLPTGTSAPTGTPTGMPTGTPAGTPNPEESAALANLVLLDNPGIGGNMTIVRAAARHFGEQVRPDGGPWAGWCEMYIGNVMDEAGIARPRYATALLDAASGPLYRGRAPAGSVVYFDQRANSNGHVGIALGDGTMLSALSNGIVRSAYENWPSYLGWRPYGTTAPPGETAIIAPLLTPTERDFPRMPAWP